MSIPAKMVSCCGLRIGVVQAAVELWVQAAAGQVDEMALQVRLDQLAG